MKRALLASGIVCCLAGCAGFNAAMTPSVKISQNAFDDTLEVYQAPVSAASSLSEAYNTLGFMWKETSPEVIHLAVGVYGIESVTSVAFNVDDTIITSAKKVGTTDIDLGHTSTLNLPNRSTGYFVMPVNDFRMVAAGQRVRMKVGLGNTYVVSSFGAESEAIVNSKFGGFLAAVDQN